MKRYLRYMKIRGRCAGAGAYELHSLNLKSISFFYFIFIFFHFILFFFNFILFFHFFISFYFIFDFYFILFHFFLLFIAINCL